MNLLTYEHELDSNGKEKLWHIINNFNPIKLLQLLHNIILMMQSYEYKHCKVWKEGTNSQWNLLQIFAELFSSLSWVYFVHLPIVIRKKLVYVLYFFRFVFENHLMQNWTPICIN